MRGKAETKGVLPLSDARPLAVLVGAVRFVVAEPLPDLVNLRVCVSLASVKHTRHQPNTHTHTLSLSLSDTHTHTHTHQEREEGGAKTFQALGRVQMYDLSGEGLVKIVQRVD